MEKIDLAERIEKCFIYVNDGEIYRSVIGDAEKLLLEKTLQKTRGNQILAARILGLNRNTLRTKIRKLKIDLESFK